MTTWPKFVHCVRFVGACFLSYSVNHISAYAGTTLTGMMGRKVFFTLRQPGHAANYLSLKPGQASGDLEVIQVFPARGGNEKIDIRFSGTKGTYRVGMEWPDLPNTEHNPRTPPPASPPETKLALLTDFASPSELKNFIWKDTQEIFVESCNLNPGVELQRLQRKASNENWHIEKELSALEDRLDEVLNAPSLYPSGLEGLRSKIAQLSKDQKRSGKNHYNASFDFDDWRLQQRKKYPDEQYDPDYLFVDLVGTGRVLCRTPGNSMGRCCGGQCVPLGTVPESVEEEVNSCQPANECGMPTELTRQNATGSACVRSAGESVQAYILSDLIKSNDPSAPSGTTVHSTEVKTKADHPGVCQAGECKICPDAEGGCAQFDLALDDSGELTCAEKSDPWTKGVPCNASGGTCQDGKCVPHPGCESTTCGTGSWNADLEKCEQLPKNDGGHCELGRGKSGVCVKGTCSSCKSDAPNETLPACPASVSWPCRVGKRIDCNSPTVCDYLQSPALPNGVQCTIPDGNNSIAGVCWDGLCRSSSNLPVSNETVFMPGSAFKDLSDPGPSYKLNTSSVIDRAI